MTKKDGGNSPIAIPWVGRQPWGSVPDGDPAELYTLSNANGLQARIATYGAILVSLTAPDRCGRFAHVVLGFDTLDEYTNSTYQEKGPHFGATIGRYANRIAKGRFTLHGNVYTLAVNRPPNHLHGGVRGFDKVNWQGLTRLDPDPSVELRYTSQAGEEGYPGTVDVSVTYRLSMHNELWIDYRARADEDTVVNFTNHSYFNLKGDGCGDILDHQLQINAERFTPIDSNLIPTGELAPVKGTPFDFTQPIAIGARIDLEDDQLRLANGYDHNFVLRDSASASQQAARVWEASTGRTLEVWTSEPGVQFYSGNSLKGDFIGRHGRAYAFREGFCLETQHFPNSVNEPGFPTTLLRADAPYASTTVFRLGVEEVT